MSFSSVSEQTTHPPHYRLLLSTLLVLTCILAWAALILPISIRPTSFPIKAGDVASQDIQAPYALSYTSAILTKRAQDDAVSRVSPVYLPADPSITRRQIELLRMDLAFINTVRFDTYSTEGQKLADLSAIPDLKLTDTTWNDLLSLSDSRWQILQNESTSVLEQVMRNTIRDINLPDARRSIPTLVSLSLSQEQASLVTELVTPFIVPNSLFSQDQTDDAKEKVQESVAPVARSYVSGETIVFRGQVINETDWEALVQYGLVTPRSSGQEYLSAATLVLLLGGFTALYFNRRKSPQINDFRGLFLMAVTFLLYLFSARYIIPNRTILPYLFPIPAFGLTIAALFNMELGLVFSLTLSILAAYGLPNSLDLTFFYILSSLCGVLVLGRARRISMFFWSALAIGLAGAAIVFSYRLSDTITDWVGIITLIGASFFNGLASASLTLLFQFLFAQLLGITTALQLLEISRPDHPLLQFVLRNAPGTYQHTLQVANLAEQAAESIGADALLTRVGAIYHDSGKAMNPSFFIENQVPGKLNPHDDLDPAVSAATIIQHVIDGVQLAKKYRLPPRIQDFLLEHHGTLLTRYQYTHAVEAAGNDPDLVDMELFRYPGPRPQSKETALLMLADGVEARARAELPKNETELRQLIRRVIDYALKEGQLDDTDLTLKDMGVAAESFLRTLRGIYHPRILYPELKGKPAESIANSPTTPVSDPNQTSIK